jgi:hypothetical protein
MRKKLKIADFLPVIDKAKKVVNSCETVGQLRVAQKYIEIADRWMWINIKKNKAYKNERIWGFYNDATTHLHEVLFDKIKEMEI